MRNMIARNNIAFVIIWKCMHVNMYHHRRNNTIRYSFKLGRRINNWTMAKIVKASSILIHNATIHRITVTFQPLEELQVVQRPAFNKPANFNMLQNDSHVKPIPTIYKQKLLVAHSSTSFNLMWSYLKHIYH